MCLRLRLRRLLCHHGFVVGLVSGDSRRFLFVMHVLLVRRSSLDLSIVAVVGWEAVLGHQMQLSPFARVRLVRAAFDQTGELA